MQVLNTFLTSNSLEMRLARTIVQGIIGAIIANLDLLLGYTMISPELRPFVTALVMAILSPIMATIGGKTNDFESA